MASETKILEAIFGPSIPTDQAAVLPEIMAHIRAIDGLLQGKPRQVRPRISDPAISGPINLRIGQLYAEHGKDWPTIAATIGREFQVQISPDACRGRYRDAVARQEAYAALQGSAIQALQKDPTVEPLGNPEQLPTSFGQFIPHEPPVDPIVDPKPGQVVAQRPDDRQIEAIKAEAIRLYQEGRDVGSIAEQLGVRSRWVKDVCKGIVVQVPTPLTETEIDAELIRLRDTGMSPKEIRDAMLHGGVDFGLAELRDRLSALARKALQDRKDARQASKPEIPANCNRAELDAVMWQLWDHGKGKTPDEISDLLCNNGYSYEVAMVERRLRQQGAEL